MAALPRYSRPARQAVDISSSGESTSLLEAETYYLPLPSDLSSSPVRPFRFDFSTNSPRTTSTSKPEQYERKSTGSILDVRGIHNVSSPSAAACRQLDFSDPLALRPEPRISRLAANIGSHPQKAEQKSDSHRYSGSTLSDAQTFSATISERDSLSDSNLSTLRLGELKAAIMASRKSRQKQQQQQNSRGGMDANQSSQDSLYTSQYSPKKYATPTRHSVGKSSNLDPKELAIDRGKLREAWSDKKAGTVHLNKEKYYFEDTQKPEMVAAVKVQALWRGYYARQSHPQILAVRRRLQMQRAERHIHFLTAELQRQKQLYDEEKHLRSMQLQVLQSLCQQVHLMQQQQSGEGSTAGETVHSTSRQDLLEALHKAKIHTFIEGATEPEQPVAQVTDVKLMAAGTKEAELQQTCRNLQNQVVELRQLLTHMSAYIIQGSQSGTSRDSSATSVIDSIFGTKKATDGAHTGESQASFNLSSPPAGSSLRKEFSPSANDILRLTPATSSPTPCSSPLRSPHATDSSSPSAGSGLRRYALKPSSPPAVNVNSPRHTMNSPMSGSTTRGHTSDSPSPPTGSSSRQQGSKPSSPCAGSISHRPTSGTASPPAGSVLQRYISESPSPPAGSASRRQASCLTSVLAAGNIEQLTSRSSPRDSSRASMDASDVDKKAIEGGRRSSSGSTENFVGEERKSPAVDMFASIRRSRSRSNEKIEGAVDSDCEQPSTRRQEGLIKHLDVAKEIKLTSKMLKRKNSPADAQGPLRAFSIGSKPSGEDGVETGGNTSSDKQSVKLTTPSKIPVFKTVSSELRRSSFELNSSKEWTPIPRSQSAGSLGSGTAKSNTKTLADSHMESDPKVNKSGVPSPRQNTPDIEINDNASVLKSSGRKTSDSEKVDGMVGVCPDAGSGNYGQREGQADGSTCQGEEPPSTRQHHLSGGSSNDSLYNPKPPDSPRIGLGLVRRNSFRKKEGDQNKEDDKEADGKVAQPLEVNVLVKQTEVQQSIDKSVCSDGTAVHSTVTKSDAPQETEASSAAAVEREEICQEFAVGDEGKCQQSRGRAPVRINRKANGKAEKRSASTGSILRHLTGGCCSANVVVASKPPLFRPGLGDAGAGPTKQRSASGEAGRTKQHLRSEKQSSRKPMTHRRCHSDAAAIELSIESPDDGDHRTPTKAPGSPRVRRSSSFSKASSSSSNETEQQSFMRKGVSIQELKEAASKERKQVMQKHLGYDNSLTKSAIRKNGKESSDKDDSNQPGTSIDSSWEPEVAAAQAVEANMQSPHSPKVGGRSLDTKPRPKAKIGRAADLFAKLQLKLSPKS